MECSRVARLRSPLNSTGANIWPGFAEQLQSSGLQFAVKGFTRVCNQDRHVRLPNNVAGVYALVDEGQSNACRSFIDDTPNVRMCSSIVREICRVQIDATLRQQTQEIQFEHISKHYRDTHLRLQFSDSRETFRIAQITSRDHLRSG